MRVLLIKHDGDVPMSYEVVMEYPSLRCCSFGGFVGDHSLERSIALAIRASTWRVGYNHPMPIIPIGFDKITPKLL